MTRRSFVVSNSLRIFLGVALVIGALFGFGCATETVDTTTMPTAVRSDYVVFAQRCSKCHSLARPLNAGIRDDAWWVSYVTRMRLQPESGISADDQVVILRFLHYYDEAQTAKANAAASADGGVP